MKAAGTIIALVLVGALVGVPLPFTAPNGDLTQR